MKATSKSQAKRFAVQRRKSVFYERNNLVAAMVAKDIDHYLKRDTSKQAVENCYVCSYPFDKTNRHHHLCSTECRRQWHRGLFNPRKEN